MARMVQSNPRAGFKVLEGSWRELVEPLRDGEIDMIVGALRPFEIADLYQMPLYEDRLVIAAGSQHPLAGRAPALEQFPPILDRRAGQFAAARAMGAIVRGRTLPETPIECGSVMIIGRLLTEAISSPCSRPIRSPCRSAAACWPRSARHWSTAAAWWASPRGAAGAHRHPAPVPRLSGAGRRGGCARRAPARARSTGWV
jgi:DNA-binding transcriptional LysR family regulator